MWSGSDDRGGSLGPQILGWRDDQHPVLLRIDGRSVTTEAVDLGSGRGTVLMRLNGTNVWSPSYVFASDAWAAPAITTAART
ncbi:MAG: hypothetical protein R2731_03515 [Nocardioides sp.]